MSVCGYKSDDEYSVIGDKGEIGFIDYGDDKSVCSYNPNEEGSVVISVPFPFVQQKPQSVSVDEVASNSITIENTTSDSIELWGINIYASTPDDCFTLSLMEPSKPGFVGSSSLEDRILQPRKTLTVWLSCKPKEIGLHTCIVHFDVGDDKIERVVFVLAEDNISKALAAKKPYQRGRQKSQYVVDSYVKGVRPARAANRGFRNKLPMYEIPKDIRGLLESKQLPDTILAGLSRKNYVPYFRTLLIMEELRLEEDIRAYDMENVSMKNRGRQFLILEVLGLAERRPSLVHGDSVYASLASQHGNGTGFYEGWIHRVEADQVYLKFADDFHQSHHNQNQYNIRFMYNRVNMRRLYHATEAAEGLHVDFLFPSESSEKRRIKPTTVVPISGNLNKEQLNAVKMILGCNGGVPYIINGPPGTGKTMTLVEAVLQLYATRKFSKILICASSNSAADHILEKILNQKSIRLQKNDIFRLNASSRPYEDMNPNYLPYCFSEEGLFRCPLFKALIRFRIIITTYMSSALLHAEDVRKGHFSHIILDEAGQASEPETMVPISNLCQKETVIVLAGDPKQLGPVIFSPDAKNHGLSKSYLERLFECELYSEGEEGYVTTLQRNYRSHADILQLPSELFYCGQLIACHEIMKSIPWADLLPNKEFPILFSGVQAYDEREGDNPSWFNRTEASMVVKFIKKLIERNVSEDSIGVITPYRQQVAKIRMALDDAAIVNIKIGSVEQFQGQEREVIIISTVRSTIKHDEFDRIHYLGFLSNPKRFNVAITRARSLLVIIGNPHIICKDRNWEKLLWRCVDNDSYEGCPPPERQSSNYDNQTEVWPDAIGQDPPWGLPDSVEQVAEGGWHDGPELPTNGGWSDIPEQLTNGGWSDAPEQPINGGWSDAPEQPINGGWSDASDQETQRELSALEQPTNEGWSDTPEQLSNGGWSGAPEQPINGGWSDASDQETRGRLSVPEQPTNGGWSGAPEQPINGGWSDASDQETQGGLSVPEQPTNRGWSGDPEQPINGGWSDASDRETQGGLSVPEQPTSEGWSRAPEQPINGGWSDASDQARHGGFSAPEQSANEGGPDAPELINGRWADAPDQETLGRLSDPVEQCTQGWSNSLDQAMKEGCLHGPDQANGVCSDGPEHLIKGSNRADKETQWGCSDSLEQDTAKSSSGIDKQAKSRHSHGSGRGRKVCQAKAEHDQVPPWKEDYPKPVKDPALWIDGWE